MKKKHIVVSESVRDFLAIERRKQLCRSIDEYLKDNLIGYKDKENK